jgi:hypothetical protein
MEEDQFTRFFFCVLATFERIFPRKFATIGFKLIPSYVYDLYQTFLKLQIQTLLCFEIWDQEYPREKIDDLMEIDRTNLDQGLPPCRSINHNPK